MRRLTLLLTLLAAGCEPAKLPAPPPPAIAPAPTATEPVLMVFSAKWCVPCRQLAPTIDRVARDFKVIKVDIDDHKDLARVWRVGSIPRLLIVRDGNVVWDRTGAVPEAAIRAAMAANKK